ncbi:hypothetical protein CI109_105438 [Kwoniella shandongensis]|uniref:Uncharacterized protein n=1 Tax=Kwoniella shandongensis TaxID=1734106 RepID=A0A5M6C7U0_9TREE|nr:uncharacterized protein CI109_002159 [Kwoniella shandongensis]KAA5529269.1 hypothetical protein CI109_002159 [Kwoniella shandongensis]
MPSFNPFAKSTASTSPNTSSKSRRYRIFLSYAPDWCLTIVLWGLFYLLDKINGYRRLFDINDTSLAHPYADPERVPVWLLAVICGIVPALVIIFTAGAIRRSFWDGQSGLLGLILGLGLTITFTNIIKITAGRPRPDLFARCILPEGLTTNPVHGLTSWTVCTQTDDSRLQEGFRSFPSGHSSFAWCGMWYMILYLAAKMRINNRTGYTYKSWLLLAPLSCCTLVSVSRTMDYRHHSTDVIAGAIIGIAGAWYAYRQYYPALAHPQAYKPYSPRIPKDESIPLHNRPATHRPSSEVMLAAPGQNLRNPSPSTVDTVDGNATSYGLTARQGQGMNGRLPGNEWSNGQNGRVDGGWTTAGGDGEDNETVKRPDERMDSV